MQRRAPHLASVVLPEPGSPLTSSSRGQAGCGAAGAATGAAAAPLALPAPLPPLAAIGDRFGMHLNVLYNGLAIQKLLHAPQSARSRFKRSDERGDRDRRLRPVRMRQEVRRSRMDHLKQPQPPAQPPRRAARRSKTPHALPRAPAPPRSTTGAAVAATVPGCAFLDADDFHPPASVEKMRSGLPLTDADRAPWLAALRRQIELHIAR